jgi:hypothetical protein
MRAACSGYRWKTRRGTIRTASGCLSAIEDSDRAVGLFPFSNRAWLPLNEYKTADVDAGSQTKINFHAEALRRMSVVLSWQRIVWKWRRKVAAKRMSAEYGGDVPLGIG